jgi:Protein of unknown function (DUF3043)
VLDSDQEQPRTRRSGQGSGGASQAGAGGSQASAPAKPAGKGRPTPKRSEVERRRREPYGQAATQKVPPGDRKAAAAARREESRRRMDAMKRGEEWALPARDRGPVKALVRDYIDSRKLVVSEYVLFGVFVLIFLLWVLGAAKHSQAILYLELGILALIGVESSYHTFRVARLVRRRLPGQSTRGINFYVLKRSIRLRSTRIPPPRVARGDPI